MNRNWKMVALAIPLGLTLACLAGPLSPAVAGDRDERAKIGAAGGNGGEAFHDQHLPPGTRVIGVKIRHGDLVDAVELLYKTADGMVESLGRHGGDGGGEDTFLLNRGEYIKGIKGTTGEFVVSMTIITNQRESPKYGGTDGEGPNRYFFVAPGNEVIGFLGHSGAYVDRIGVYVRRR